MFLEALNRGKMEFFPVFSGTRIRCASAVMQRPRIIGIFKPQITPIRGQAAYVTETKKARRSFEAAG